MKQKILYRIKRGLFAIKRVFIRKLRFNMSWVVFIICIILLSTFIFTYMFQKFPSYDKLNEKYDLPYKLEIKGKVDAEKYNNCYLKIGGFSQRLGKTSEYRMAFLSGEKQDIPILVVGDDNQVIYVKFISFEKDEWEKNIDLK